VLGLSNFIHRDGLIEKGRGGLLIGCRFDVSVSVCGLDVRRPENLRCTLREREEKE
jgi:hypothetical protein